MSWGKSIAKCFKKFAVFSGRASRSEYCWWCLFVFLITSSLLASAIVIDEYFRNYYTLIPSLLLTDAFFGLSVLVPSFAVTIRRLHDTNHSGWWILCPIYNFVLLVTPGDPDVNNYETPEDKKKEFDSSQKKSEIIEHIHKITKRVYNNATKIYAIIASVIFLCGLLTIVIGMLVGYLNKEENTSKCCENPNNIIVEDESCDSCNAGCDTIRPTIHPQQEQRSKLHSSAVEYHALTYGRWYGKLLNGNPNGRGKLVITKETQIIVAEKKVIFQEGDSIVGVFRNGKPINAEWYKKNGYRETLIAPSAD